MAEHRKPAAEKAVTITVSMPASLIDKVIFGLRCHKAGFYEECLNCPYHEDGCETTLCNDAISMLKELRETLKGGKDDGSTP